MYNYTVFSNPTHLVCGLIKARDMQTCLQACIGEVVLTNGYHNYTCPLYLLKSNNQKLYKPSSEPVGLGLLKQIRKLDFRQDLVLTICQRQWPPILVIIKQLGPRGAQGQYSQIVARGQSGVPSQSVSTFLLCSRKDLPVPSINSRIFLLHFCSTSGHYYQTYFTLMQHTDCMLSHAKLFKMTKGNKCLINCKLCPSCTKHPGSLVSKQPWALHRPTLSTSLETPSTVMLMSVMLSSPCPCGKPQVPDEAKASK